VARTILIKSGRCRVRQIRHGMPGFRLPVPAGQARRFAGRSEARRPDIASWITNRPFGSGSVTSNTAAAIDSCPTVTVAVYRRSVAPWRPGVPYPGTSHRRDYSSTGIISESATTRELEAQQHDPQ
jgi:hypothetical protein